MSLFSYSSYALLPSLLLSSLIHINTASSYNQMLVNGHTVLIGCLFIGLPLGLSGTVTMAYGNSLGLHYLDITATGKPTQDRATVITD